MRNTKVWLNLNFSKKVVELKTKNKTKKKI